MKSIRRQPKLTPDNRVLSSYLPDGTLMAREFRSVRTRTTVRVNSKGDTVVRTIREPVIDRTLYRGDWEINGSVWRLNTPEGIATVVKDADATADNTGRTFTHLWYVRDRLGSVRTVLDDKSTIRQCTMFYPSGLPVQLFGTERVTDRAHIGNRWINFAGLGQHDNIARWHDAILSRFTTPDPKAADYPSFSPYTHCAANPLRFTDPTGERPIVYIETNSWGHVFLSTGEGASLTVYTYGRYGNTWKNIPSVGSTAGEGILIRLKGNDAQRFINDEDKRFGLNAFAFEQDKDAEINAYFDNILQEKSADPSNKRDVKNIGKGIVIDEYNVVNNNCVTTSLNAIQAVGIDVSSIVAISPAQLLTKMQNALKASKSNWLIRLLMGETGQPPFYETEIDK